MYVHVHVHVHMYTNMSVQRARDEGIFHRWRKVMTVYMRVCVFVCMCMCVSVCVCVRGNMSWYVYGVVFVNMSWCVYMHT